MPNRPKKKSKNMSEETQTQEPGINIGDVSAALRIIDVAAKRGAFEGAELSSVGSIRDRFAAFVDFHTPKEDENKEDEATTPGAEATEETSE
jgi:hypothetical protein